jgi:hypothetical protein
MATSTAPLTSAVGSATMTVPSATPFVSSHYGYAITSEEWTGTDATTAWDGTGSPGHDDPAVDMLKDLEEHTAPRVRRAYEGESPGVRYRLPADERHRARGVPGQAGEDWTDHHRECASDPRSDALSRL